MAVGLVEIQKAVCDCINNDLQDKLIECGIGFVVGNDQIPGKTTTKAICVYSPEYDTCKENELFIHVFGVRRQLLLLESIAACRGGKEKHIQKISADYTVKVEVVKTLCGKTEHDAFPIHQADELQRLLEAIEDLLFCKRQIEVGGHKFYQEDVDPFQIGYDEIEFSKGTFIKNVAFTYRLNRCC